MHTKIRRNKLIEILYAEILFLLCFTNRILSLKYETFFSVLNYLRLVFLIWLVFFCLVSKIRYSKTFILATIIAIIVIFSTWLHHGLLSVAINQFTRILIVIISLDTVKKKKKSVDTLLGTWMTMMAILAVIDFFSIILYPTGLYTTEFYSTNYFLGYKTERMIYILPMVTIAFYLSEDSKRNTLYAYIFSLISLCGYFFINATAGFCILLMIIVLSSLIKLLYSSHTRKWICNIVNIILDYRFFIIIYIIFVIIIIVVQQTNIVATISLYFGKRNGLSDRTGIWKACITEIYKYPLLGLGVIDPDRYIQLTNNIYGTNAHNMFLTIGIDGGIMAIFIYFVIIINTLHLNNKTRANNSIIVISIYALLLLGITSSIFVFSQYGMLFFWISENSNNYNKSKIFNYKTAIYEN